MRLILILSFYFLSLDLSTQGFNNNEKIDQEDLKVLFRQSKLTPFKFSFFGTGDSSLNIVVEQYIDGKLVITEDFYQDTKSILSMSDEPKNFYYPALNRKTKRQAHIYFDENNKDTLRLWVHTTNIQKHYSFPIAPNLLTETRAFDEIPAELKRRQPLVVFYGNEGMMISCPGDAKPADIVRMYKVVVIVYAEPVRP
jgi:hypothetical protein